MRIVFMGTPEFALPALERLLQSDHDVVGVYTQPDRPVGRGRKLLAPPVKQMVEDEAIAVFQPVTFSDVGEVSRLIELKPDVMVVVAYGRMLPQSVLDIPSFGCLNIHPSLLPRYRGASPVASAILSGDTETGVTIMLLDAGMDSGPVISQKRVVIGPRVTTESLTGELARLGAELLIETLPAWLEGSLAPQPQDDSVATFTRTIAKSDGEVDWTLSAVEIDRRLRAFHPWPGGYTRWQGKSLKLLEAVPMAGESELSPGTVVSLTGDSQTPVGVVAGNGLLGLRKVQLEGKKACSAIDFLRGQRNFIGQRMG